MLPRFVFALLLATVPALATAAQSGRVQEHPLESALGRLKQTLPKAAAEFSSEKLAAVEKLAESIEAAAAELALPVEIPSADTLLAIDKRLLAAKSQVDAELQRTLALRGSFVELPKPRQRSAMLAYVRTTAELIDLSGRLRYTLYDSLSEAAAETAADAARRETLLDMLLEHRSSIGAAVLMPLLFDDLVQAEGAAPVSTATKQKLLTLAGSTGQTELLPQLARFVRQADVPTDLLLAAAEAIRNIGLPQDAQPGQDPALPKPAITASELHELLTAKNGSSLRGSTAKKYAELVAWLKQRAEQGVTRDAFRLGGFEVLPGDWLLMRNPSPYNLFTDLSPGLFTHVGVVAAHTASDGIRRIVIVDLPEKGTRMPATNADVFVQRTLHYVVLRHPEQHIADRMAEVAASTIGQQTEFDLNFRTERLLELKGQPLDGRTIQTYCAGLLLLCAQATTAPREEFFPVAEFPAGGHTVENLATIGITFGDNFVSPTGALFSPKLQLVGTREPMYDPRREVEEAVFDHFARSVAIKKLSPSLDWLQTLKTKLAAAADLNPALATALARAADAPKQTELASAAKAAAVIETLDEIAFGASGDFLAARRAVLEGAQERRSPNSDDEAKRNAELRKLHVKLIAQWEQGLLTPRDLRLALVQYYISRGKRELDERFFRQDDGIRATNEGRISQ